MRRVCSAFALVVAGSVGCSTMPMPMHSDAGIDADVSIDVPTSMDAGSGPVLDHVVGPFDLAPGEEQTNTCASWSLNNTETIYVNAVDMSSGGGVHHSNWFFVPPSYFRGPDGVWNCSDRSFDQAVAAAFGGVLFGQTTQATSETEQFPPGAVIPIPPYSRIVGGVHLLNATGSPLRTWQHFTLHTIPADQVTVRLAGFAMQYTPLYIPPHTRSEFTVTCDLGAEHERVTGRPLDFRIYHGLPHYHALGRMLRLSIVGGPQDGQVIQQTTAALGDPQGRMFDPPIDLTGATGLTLTCDFDNSGDTTVTWGNGSGEMCIWFGYTDSEREWAIGAQMDSTNMVTGSDAGVITNTAPCRFVSTASVTHDL